jgi:hypothetical protein
MELGEERISVGEEDAIDRVTRASVLLLDRNRDPVVHRGQHPKMSGLVRAEFTVLPDLPDSLRVGLFREPKSYPVWIRFSNGVQTDDRKPDAHGMAIKLMGVDGEKILESEQHARTHDFVLVDNPTFFIRNPQEYSRFSEALVKAKGKAPSIFRKILFFLPEPLRVLLMLLLLYFLPARLDELAMLLKFGRKKPTNPLGSRYWSTTPYKMGVGRAVKYSAVPEEWNDDTSPTNSPNYLRQGMIEHLEAREALFTFRVQIQTDPLTMPVEDPTIAWDEATSPYVAVARIRIPVQKFDDAACDTFGENLSFTPWHALPEHRPLGGINRTRRQVYEALSKLRHELNDVPMSEPTPDVLPVARRTDTPLTFAEVLEAELELIEVRRRGINPGIEPEPRPTPRVEFNDDDGRLMRARVEALNKHVTGITFSGGGIRAATFAVGFIQGMASFGLLRKFDYLSTVSGGGYAGSWLAAWLKREGDVGCVEDQLCDDRVRQADANRMFLGSTATGPRPVVDEEPETIRHLRAYSSYITPRAGLMTADTWTVILIWIRNVSINMLMILPMVMMVVLGIRLATYGYHYANYIIEGQPAEQFLTPVLLVAGLVCLLVAFWNNGLVIVSFRRANSPRWPIDLPGRMTKGILQPLLASAILLTMPIRFVLWQLGRSLEEVASRLTGPANSPPRIMMDFITGNLGIFGMSNVLLHIAFFGSFVAFGAWIIARRSGKSGRRFVEAGFLSGMSMGLLALLIEWMIRAFGAASRPDLMTVFGPPSLIGALLVSIIVEVGLLGRAISEAEREWWARLSALMMISSLFWLSASAIILYLPAAILSTGGWSRTILASGWVLSTAAGILLGRPLPIRRKSRQGKSLATFAGLAPPIFVAGLLGLVALFASWLLNMPGLDAPHDQMTGPFAYYLKGVVGTPFWRIAVCFAITYLCYRIGRQLIDVNLFSLNAMYANRITRCYLGASRSMPGWQRRWGSPRDPRADAGAPSLSVDDPATGDEERFRPTVRDSNPVTGFDPSDDIPLADLLIGRDQPGERAYWGPHLLINTTLNLVGGQDLAWRDRKGESFQLTPLYCGAKSLGYARLPEGTSRNLTLGRAVAISGAAVDPNMSFYQSGMLPAFLTFFNARLGYWIENPSRPHWAARGPRSGQLLTSELTGQTNGLGDFVHLSDGGHFENMGVYELIRRRCRYIVALDAGEDIGASDENLARLVRLSWIDFGVRIQLDTDPLAVEGIHRTSNSHVVVGRIRYDDVDQGEMPGVFVYVKATLTGDEPPDVQEYARRHPDFPHEAISANPSARISSSRIGASARTSPARSSASRWPGWDGLAPCRMPSTFPRSSLPCKPGGQSLRRSARSGPSRSPRNGST